ncbi:MAG: hypothetical protein AAGE80_18400 [Pseudomonadota bacterium]
MTKRLAGGICAVMLALSAGSASAITVDFTGQNAAGPSFIFDTFDGGAPTGITVTATATEGGISGTPVNVGRTNGGGLGVNGLRPGQTGGQIDDNPGGNPAQFSEFLTLTFSTPVVIETITFANAAGSNDSFTLFVDGIDADILNTPGFEEDRIQSLTPEQSGSVREVDFSTLALVGTIFQITDGTGQIGGDDFSVAALSFTEAIPLPAPILLLLAGLASLGLVARRRPA